MPAARGADNEAIYAAEEIAGLLLILDLTVKALTETFRKFILNTIRHQLDDVSGSVENRRAVRARLKVGLHPCAQLGADLSVDVIGKLSPDL